MPWGHRSYAVSRSRNTSAWNTKGETCSLNRALAIFELTEEQVRSADPPVSCQWRSCHGNPYAVVKMCDMHELKARLDKQAKEDEKKALIEKLGGQEAYDKKMAEEKAEEEAAAKAAKEAAERKGQVDKIEGYISVLMKLPSTEATSLENVKIPKTRAKHEWFLRDSDVEDLPGEKVGRSIQYDLQSVISAAEKRHGSPFSSSSSYSTSLLDKIQGVSDHRVNQYAAYLRQVFDDKVTKVYSEELIHKASQESRKSIEKSIQEAHDKVCQAELQVKKSKADLAMKQRALTQFKNLAETLVSTSTKRDGPDKENVAPNEESLSKKPKLG